jgi:hypothetical protein
MTSTSPLVLLSIIDLAAAQKYKMLILFYLLCCFSCQSICITRIKLFLSKEKRYAYSMQAPINSQ